MSLSLYTFNIMLCPGDSKMILKTKETLSLLLASSFLHFCNLFLVHFSCFSYTILALSPFLECFLFPPPLFSPCPSTLCDLTQQWLRVWFLWSHHPPDAGHLPLLCVPRETGFLQELRHVGVLHPSSTSADWKLQEEVFLHTARLYWLFIERAVRSRAHWSGS